MEDNLNEDDINRWKLMEMSKACFQKCMVNSCKTQHFFDTMKTASIDDLYSWSSSKTWNSTVTIQATLASAWHSYVNYEEILKLLSVLHLNFN